MEHQICDAQPCVTFSHLAALSAGAVPALTGHFSFLSCGCSPPDANLPREGHGKSLCQRGRESKKKMDLFSASAFVLFSVRHSARFWPHKRILLWSAQDVLFLWKLQSGLQCYLDQITSVRLLCTVSGPMLHLQHLLHLLHYLLHLLHYVQCFLN